MESSRHVKTRRFYHRQTLPERITKDISQEEESHTKKKSMHKTVTKVIIKHIGNSN